MKSFELELAKILSDNKCWETIGLTLNQYKFSGKIFEAFCKYYFLCDSTVKDDYLNVWYFNEIPERVKEQLGFIGGDYGVDLLLQDIDNQYIAVQCKFRSDFNSRLNWTADKIANLFAYADKADGFIVFTNVSEIDFVSKSRHNFSFFNISNLLNIESSTFNTIKTKLDGLPTPPLAKFNPKEHQLQAIQNCVDFFQIEDRGQLIMPCGSGKTLTSLWIKEKLQSKNTLVLVPSLALLRQIKEDWARQRRVHYHYLCVCSETDIDINDEGDVDSFVTHTYELGGRVTTDIEVIKKFLQSDFDKVIFSTYQSLAKIELALKGSNFEFDFALCDEAHKTAGINQGLFGIIHDNNKIAVKKRLYMTATPRIVSDNIKKKLGEDLKYAYDMSDPAIFGEEFYRMNFKSAIREGILVDYKIITIGVTDDELSRHIKERRYISNHVSIDELANNYALEMVMQRYSATHAITFHSRVKYAQEFSERHKKLFPNLAAFYVSGTQTTSYRSTLMNEFKNSSKAVISNARCLTEGVDVPAIDLIYFCDPKNSKVDIVQAVGRALRQDKAKDKIMGFVVIPVFHQKREKVENAINQSTFRNLITVIRALCDQDERLQDEINLLAFGKGKKSDFSKIEFVSGNIFTENKIHLVGFDEKLKNTLFDQIIERTSNNWDLWFLQLKEHLEQHNNEYPTQEQNLTLYRWIAIQRHLYKKKQLSANEIKALKSIDFIWDARDNSWNKQFESLKNYAEEVGFEPSQTTELGIWYQTQKQAIKKGKLSEERKQKIISIQFNGKSIEIEWQKRFEELMEFRKDNPNKWPQYNRQKKNSNQNDLSIFCQSMRKFYRKNTLSDYWVDKLLSIKFNFEGKKDNWLEYYEKLKKYVLKHQAIPDVKNNQNLYMWARNNRDNYIEGSLNENQKRLLDEINLHSLFKSKTWEEWYQDVKAFYELADKLPTVHSEKQLGSWLNVQRQRGRKNELSDEEKKKLEAMSIIWDGDEAKKDRWGEMFDKVKAFYEKNNRFPNFISEEGEKQLYNWCQQQRQRQAGTASGGRTKPLEEWQVKKLEAIGFDFKPRGTAGLDENWEEKYQELEAFLKNKNLSELPSLINGDSNPLYRWLTNQKLEFRKGKLRSDRELKLRGLGIRLEEEGSLTGKRVRNSWLDTYQELKAFLEINGSSIPNSRGDEKEKKLYRFYYNNRKKYEDGELEAEKIQLLHELKLL